MSEITWIVSLDEPDGVITDAYLDGCRASIAVLPGGTTGLEVHGRKTVDYRLVMLHPTDLAAVKVFAETMLRQAAKLCVTTHRR